MLKALDFILDNIALSSFDGWFIHSINATSSQDEGDSLKVFQDYIFTKQIPIFQGAYYQGNKNLKIRIGKIYQTDEIEANTIKTWLKSSDNYRKIIFLQDDLSEVYFNVLVTKVSIGYVGNQPAYIDIDLMCDSAFGWSGEKEIELTKGLNTIYLDTSMIDTYPIVEFTCNKSNGKITLINQSKNNLKFEFSKITTGETIRVDNDKQIVYQSSLGMRRLKDFNKGWMCFKIGQNILNATGDFSSMKVIYKCARRML